MHAITTEINAKDGKILQELTRDFGQTIIAVTHDEDFAHKSDRIIEMKDGEILR